MTFAHDNLRAAVAAGLIDERQAAGILALAEARQGARKGFGPREEPFELFRGFNEIFIVVGLGVVVLGAQWERLRGWLMRTLPDFPGNSCLPPWGGAVSETTA